MSGRIACLFAIVLSILMISCFEGDDDPVSPGDPNAPDAEILSPEHGATFPLGAVITFIGAGNDPQDGELHGSSLVWRVDRTAILGTGDTIATGALAEGTHDITLTATDSDGKSGSDGISIEVTVEDLSLASAWPNGDGSRWTYDYAGRWWSDVPAFVYWPTPEEVPDIPSMEELEDLLRNQPAGAVNRTDEAEYRLEFAGDTTTHSGATAQNLRETMIPGPGAVSAPGAAGAQRAFLSRLRAARPDLAARIESAYPGIDFGGDGPRGINSSDGLLPDLLAASIREPILVHGYAWEKTADWIGTYGDVDQALAWKFLEANLGIGHEFTFQLVPSLADDVYLHCKVLRTLTAHTEAGSFAHSIECLYAIDYGIFTVIGTTDLYSRVFEYGSVIYSPGIGPVYSYERIMLSPGDPPSLGIGELEISLREAVIR